MISRTDNRDFSNIFFAQSTDDLKQYCVKGLRYSLEAPTTPKQTEAIRGFDWLTCRLSDLDDLPQIQVYPKSGLKCSFGDLVDGT